MDDLNEKFSVICKECKSDAELMFTNGDCMLFNTMTPRVVVVCPACGSHVIEKDSYILDSIIKLAK